MNLEKLRRKERHSFYEVEEERKPKSADSDKLTNIEPMHNKAAWMKLRRNKPEIVDDVHNEYAETNSGEAARRAFGFP